MNFTTPKPKVRSIEPVPSASATTTPAHRKGTIATRICLVSDSHSVPLYKSTDKYHAYKEPLPESDILIHAGDLSNSGAKRQYEVTFQVLAQAKAELKLVIAGNHDLTLDKEHWFRRRSTRNQTEEDKKKDIDLVEDVRELWTGDRAKEHGIIFLDEGVHSFTLSNGAAFTIYASPYTPEFCGWAFAYERDVDRYNPSESSADNSPFPSNPVPSFPDIDLLISHGPPTKMLDRCKDGTLAGCEALWKAVTRARPRLHVFGHIHEDWGAEKVNWVKGESTWIEIPEDDETILQSGWVGFDGTGKKGTSRAPTIQSSVSDKEDGELKFGEETLFVNAAIMNTNFRPMNAPWLVDLLLPKKEEEASQHTL